MSFVLPFLHDVCVDVTDELTNTKISNLKMRLHQKEVGLDKRLKQVRAIQKVTKKEM